MARPRKPTNILALAGAFKANPERKKSRAKEPIAGEFNKAPPAYFNARQEKAWTDIVRGAPPGVLTRSDELFVESVAQTLAMVRDKPSVPLSGVRTRLSSDLSRLGMTPSGRASLSLDQPKANDFDDV